MQVGKWRIDAALDEISSDSGVVKLEPRMMRLLCRLAQAPGRVVSTQQLLDDVWNGVTVGSTSVYQAVYALRKTLGDTGSQPTYIATVQRKGYRLIAEVRLAASNPPSASAPTAPPPLRKRKLVAWYLIWAACVLVAAALITTFEAFRR